LRFEVLEGFEIWDLAWRFKSFT